TALRPEPHTLLTVKAAMVSGRPALRAACRAGFWPTPAWMTLPRMTSSTRSAGTRARRRASATATAPSCGAGTSARLPRYLPMGVRAAERTKASGMAASFYLAFARGCLIINNYKPWPGANNARCRRPAAPGKEVGMAVTLEDLERRVAALEREVAALR